MDKKNDSCTPLEQEKRELIQLIKDDYIASSTRYALLLKALTWGIVGVVLGIITRFILLLDLVFLPDRDRLIVTSILVIVMSSLTIIALVSSLYYAMQVRKRVGTKGRDV